MDAKVCRGLCAKHQPHHLLPLDFEQGRDRGSPVATDWWRRRRHGGRGARGRRENGEASKGTSMEGPPWTRAVGEVAAGGKLGRRARPHGRGGAPVLPRPREGAEEARLAARMLRRRDSLRGCLWRRHFPPADGNRGESARTTGGVRRTAAPARSSGGGARWGELGQRD
jgi:hypothetical protein